MKVLQIVKTNDGASWAYNQAKAIHDLGVDVTCVLPSISGGYADRYKLSGMGVVALNLELALESPMSFQRRAEQLKRIVEAENPDIIHCHFVTNIMFIRLALKRSSIPRVFQVPGPLHLDSPVFRTGEIATSKKGVDFWVPTCAHSRERYLQAGVSSDRMRLIYYGGYGGSEVDAYLPPQGRLHQEFDLDEKKKIVGMVSYFYKPSKLKGQKRGIKGHEDFIDAMSLLAQHRDDFLPMIIGGPWNNCLDYEEYLKKYASQKLGSNIVFTGFRTDMKSIYRELGVAVHPSHSENLGGAAESLAAGVPTVATNIGGFPDIVIDNETGYLVDLKSPEQIAHAVARLLDDGEKAKKMADRGQNRVREMLDLNNSAKEMMQFYRYILKDGQ